MKIENLVLIDYAGKNTYKKKEKHNEIYNEVKKEFITDFNKQSSLLIESINHLKNQKNLLMHLFLYMEKQLRITTIII